MAAPELDPHENAHLRQLMLDALAAKRWPSRNRLARDLDIQGSSLGGFLNEGGGASKATARRFAELMGISFEEAIGLTGNIRRLPDAARVEQKHRPSPEAKRVAKIYLKEPPQTFSDAAIDQALREAIFESAEDANSPSKVAEACRGLILGSAALPPPSAAPPGTRRSKMRAR